jgi:bifunctional non-homologous end joining protein LigD
LRLAGALLLGTADWMGSRPEIPTRAHFCGCPNVPNRMDHGRGTAGRCRFRQCPEPGEVVTAIRLAQRCSGLYGPPCSFLARESRCPWLHTPRLPSPSQQAPRGSAWVHEIKHDGYRLMARRDGNRVRLFTRRGFDWSGKYPRIVDSLLSLRVRSIVVDGEAVWCGKVQLRTGGLGAS